MRADLAVAHLSRIGVAQAEYLGQDEGVAAVGTERVDERVERDPSGVVGRFGCGSARGVAGVVDATGALRGCRM